MTVKKDLKVLVRARMEETGEKYNTARRHVLAGARFRRVVDDIIKLAKRRREEEDRLYPPGEDLDLTDALRDMMGEGPPRPEEQALAAKLDALSIKDLRALGTLMYVGRDFTVEESPTTVQDIIEYHYSLEWQTDKREWVIDTLLEKHPLDEYLIAGLRIAAKASVDIERLPKLRT